MRKTIALCVLTVVLASFRQDAAVVTEENGMAVVNTTQLCQDVRGFADTTPLKIYIKGGKIVRVKPLRNSESPNYFALVKEKLLPKFVGMPVKQLPKTNVDGVTGATFSSKAVIENVKKGCEYYYNVGNK